jgi:hypothetical protein
MLIFIPMNKLPLSVAVKLLQLVQGEKITAAQLRHAIIDELAEEGIIEKQRAASNSTIYRLTKAAQLHAFLQNKLGIKNLADYIVTMQQQEVTRSQLVKAASNSKLKRVNTFKGFLVNCYEPIGAVIAGIVTNITPLPGRYTFVHDYTNFTVPEDVTIAGIENAENFAYLQQQQYLFGNKKLLFVSRYPQEQTAALREWLLAIPNPYLHFGDLDFEGIYIYLYEFKKHLGNRASFLIPPQTEQLLALHGNNALYNQQFTYKLPDSITSEPALNNLIQLFHQYKKVLEQEVFIQND